MGGLLRLKKNRKGRDFFVGDIHGMFGLLRRQLRVVGFDEEKDRLIATGDLIDRGPDSGFARTCLEKPFFYSVMGNHEHEVVRNVLIDKIHPTLMRKCLALIGGDWFCDMSRDDQIDTALTGKPSKRKARHVRVYP